MFSWPEAIVPGGAELAAHEEWNEQTSLPWHLRAYPAHSGVERLVAELNKLYVANRALHELDFEPLTGFAWIDCDDQEQSVISFIRRARSGAFVVVVLNFTPQPRYDYRIGVPDAGHYAELINSDALPYGGSNCGNFGGVASEPVAWMGMAHSLRLQLPPLAALVLALP